MLTGSEFQTLGAENRKARDPKDSLWRGNRKLMWTGWVQRSR